MNKKEPISGEELLANIKANMVTFTSEELIEEVKNFSEEDKAEVESMRDDDNRAAGVPEKLIEESKKEVKYNPALWKQYWGQTSMYTDYADKFEHPEKFRLPVCVTIPVVEGTGIRIEGLKDKDFLPNLGAIIPEHRENLIDYFKSMRFDSNGFRLIIGESNSDIYHGTNILPVDGDVKAKGWSFHRQMLYGCGYSFNTHPKERINKPILPSMLWCYIEIVDFEKASKFLDKVTGVPCMVMSNLNDYGSDFKVKQVVDRANMYCMYWQLFNKKYSDKSTDSYEDMLLEDV